MADFDDLFDHDAVDTILGDDVTYILPGGGSTALRAYVSFNVEAIGDDGVTIERQTQIAIQKKLVPNVKRDHRFVHKGITYKVDGTAFEDDVEVTLAVKRV